MMKESIDLSVYDQASRVLGVGLPENLVDGAPEEVARTLLMAKTQMQSIPDAVYDLHQAGRDFQRLNQAIDRLSDLARQSADMPEDALEARKAMQAEFEENARIVAEVAGRNDYAGPDISVESKARASGSLKILKQLIPVKAALAEALDEQAALIIEAVQQTVEFLEVVAETYVDAADQHAIMDLLQRVSDVRGAETHRGLN